MPETVLTGGCQCGAVRFRAGRVGLSAICHCRMCQKAFGSYFAPLVTVGDVEWTRGAPSWFASSNRMKRGFCEKCGTPLVCIDDKEMIEIAGGAFDDPDAAPPTLTFNADDRLALFDTLTTLPRQPNVEGEKAHNATIVSYQHPDRDTAVWPPEGARHG